MLIRRFLFALGLIGIATSALIADGNGLPLTVLVHMKTVGDYTYREGELAGTRGQGRRIEGFQINFRNPPAAIAKITSLTVMGKRHR